MKEHGREVQEKEMEYVAQIEDLSGQLSDLEIEVENLRARLEAKPGTIVDADSVSPSMFPSVAEDIRKVLGKKRDCALAGLEQQISVQHSRDVASSKRTSPNCSRKSY
jgi:hypothetical protein